MSEPLCPSNDPAEQREAQQPAEVQERLVAFGRLAAGTLHDFNNSLAVIVLHAQIGLLQSDLTPTLRECLSTILHQAEAAGELVHQVLNSGRGATLQLRPLRLGPFVAEQVRLLSRTLPENIALHFAEEFAPYTINADPARLQQVIVNLALNARDAMSDGGELRFVLEEGAVGEQRTQPAPGEPPDLRPRSSVRLRISDTGGGIPAHVLPHLFEPFFTTKPASGLGLGLVQVQDIVRQHEGRIEVASEPGHGATFTLYFPGAPEPAADPLNLGHGETVLLVEDDQSVRRALVISLEQLGYQPLQARNGREALSLLLAGAEEIALVLSDIIMPEMGGPALLEAIKEHNLTTPLVFLSGRALEDVSLPPAEQYAGSLQKPVQLDALATLLARIIAARS